MGIECVLLCFYSHPERTLDFVFELSAINTFFLFFFPGKLFNIILLSNIFAAVNLWTARLWMQASLF